MSMNSLLGMSMNSLYLPERIELEVESSVVWGQDTR